MGRDRRIERLIKETTFRASTEADEALRGGIARAGNGRQAEAVKRGIVKVSLARVAAAAVVVFVVGVGLRGIGSRTAYGLTEALERSENADVVHIAGWLYQRPDRDGEVVKTPFEYWVDRKNGRYKQVRTAGFIGSDPNRPRYDLKVFDGEYVMNTDYGTDDDGQQPAPRVSYTKLDPFLRRLSTRTMPAFPEFMKRPSEVKGFSKVGQGEIDGRKADVWEGEIARPGAAIPYKKLRIWLRPSTGEIVRLVRWSNSKRDPVEWVLSQESRLIEYDVVPPAGCFSTAAPDGFHLVNTKETAMTRRFGDDILFGGTSKFYGCIGFTLKDGTVIYGWHANHEPGAPQAPLLAEAVPGGPLPKLPARVAALKPWPVEEETTLLGRHLAWTQRGGKCYEWGIYVAGGVVPERGTFQDYKVVCEYEDAEPRWFRSAPNLIALELAIASEAEFETWVVEAMGALSDDGKAPAPVTYAGVLRLAGEIRQSLAR